MLPLRQETALVFGLPSYMHFYKTNKEVCLFEVSLIHQYFLYTCLILAAQFPDLCNSNSYLHNQLPDTGYSQAGFSIARSHKRTPTAVTTNKNVFNHSISDFSSLSSFDMYSWMFSDCSQEHSLFLLSKMLTCLGVYCCAVLRSRGFFFACLMQGS